MGCDMESQGAINYADRTVLIDSGTFNSMVLACHKFGDYIDTYVRPVANKLYEYVQIIAPNDQLVVSSLTYLNNIIRYTNIACTKYIKSDKHTNDPESLWKFPECYTLGQHFSEWIFKDDFLEKLPYEFINFVHKVTAAVGTAS